MKKFVFCLCVLTSISSVSSAECYTLVDNYWGGTPYDNAPRDIVASPSVANPASGYGVSKIETSISGSIMTIDIYSQFLNNIQSPWNGNIYNTSLQLGDLFISSDGWNPSGTAPNYADDEANGDWEYVVVLDNHGYFDSGNIRNEGGIASLYEINQDQIVLSQNLYTGTYLRNNQEVQYGPATQTALATSFWGIYGFGTIDDTDDYLRFSLDLSMLGPITGGLGLHWTMACANDVIEGQVPTPEPTTMILFGAGLIGLAGCRGRRKK